MSRRIPLNLTYSTSVDFVSAVMQIFRRGVGFCGRKQEWGDLVGRGLWVSNLGAVFRIVRFPPGHLPQGPQILRCGVFTTPPLFEVFGFPSSLSFL